MKKTALLVVWTAAFLVTGINPSLGQDNKAKGTMRLSLSYVQKNGESPLIKVSAKSKIGKRFEPLEGIEVALFLTEESPAGLLGKIKTDIKGNGQLIFPENKVSRLDSLTTFTIMASASATDQVESGSAELEITRARMELSLTEADSVRSISVKVFAMNEGQWKPASGAEVKLFVRRLFSDLPTGEDSYTTDEEGNIAANFDVNIPGDAAGNIWVGAKMEDNDIYGTIIALKMVGWGEPQKGDNSFSKRTLWASRDKTPLWLLIGPNAIIAVVWGLIFHLFYLIVKIRKSGMKKENV